MKALCMVIAPSYESYQAHAHPPLTRYVGTDRDWRGMSRDVSFCTVGMFDPRVMEIRERMLECGYREVNGV